MTETIVAPAKLTLSLRVTGVRADGYHLIEAEMVTLGLHDVLEVEGATTASELTVVRGATRSPGAEDDLVLRALGISGRSARVMLHKRIPAGAGLGGGSSDAAAILRWAGVTDPGAAVTLGADVPFCLRGGRASVGGIGEVVVDLPHVERTITLYTPPLHCSTPLVYREWDAMGGPRGDHGNDLEPAALSAYPELAEHRDRFASDAGTRPRLAGSGSTWFVEGAVEGADYVVTRTTPRPGVDGGVD